MKKIGILLIVSLLLVSPMAFAFSFSDFFSDLFGFGNSITGAVVGGKCKSDLNCGKGETCVKGKCASSAVCGDGVIAKLEKCDDGGKVSGDGCSEKCVVETGFSCSGKTSTCSSTCGDGVKASDESCDAGESNTNTPCTASYGGSCTYCSASCVSKTVSGGSYGDGICQTQENCEEHKDDCGECGMYTEAPTLELTSTAQQGAGKTDISLTISNANQCKIQIDQTDAVSESTKRSGRGREVDVVSVLTEKLFPCSDAENYIESEMDLLSNGNYDVTVTAINSCASIGTCDHDGKPTKTFPIVISGGTVEITLLETGVMYDALVVLPLVTVRTSGTSCTWAVDKNCAASDFNGSETNFTCSDGLRSLDLSDFSGVGCNFFRLKIDNIVTGREYLYMGGDDEEATDFILKSTGTSGPAARKVIYETIFGSEDNTGSVIDTAEAHNAIIAMQYSLTGSKYVSASDRLKLMNLYKNKEEVSKQLMAASSAFGKSEFEVAAMRASTLEVAKLTKDYIVRIKAFNSKKDETGWSTSIDEKTLELTFKKAGETSIQVKINRQEKSE